MMRFGSVIGAAAIVLTTLTTGLAEGPTAIHWATPACNGVSMSGTVVVRDGGALAGTIYANGKFVGDDKGRARTVSVDRSKTVSCGGKPAYVVVVKGSFLQSELSRVGEVDLMFASLRAAEAAKRAIACTAFHTGCE